MAEITMCTPIFVPCAIAHTSEFMSDYDEEQFYAEALDELMPDVSENYPYIKQRKDPKWNGCTKRKRAAHPCCTKRHHLDGWSVENRLFRKRVMAQADKLDIKEQLAELSYEVDESSVMEVTNIVESAPNLYMPTPAEKLRDALICASANLDGASYGLCNMSSESFQLEAFPEILAAVSQVNASLSNLFEVLRANKS